MGYVVHVWEYPAPRTLDSADSVHNMLASLPARPNPKWRLLARRVEARMAQLGVPLEEWPENSPPEESYDKRSMPLLIEGPDEFLEAVVSEANAIGLCVYDDQAARLYLPFGYHLTTEGLRRLEVAPPKLGAADVDAVIGACARAWAPRFTALGFDFTRQPYDDLRRRHALVAERKVAAGKHTVEVYFDVDAKQDLISAQVYVQVWIELPATVLEAAQGIDRIQVRGKELRGMAAFMAIPTRSPDWITIGGSLRTQEYVDRLIDGLFEYYDQELGPTLEVTRTQDGILRLLLNEREAAGELLASRAALALAWMRGDVVLERLSRLLRERDRFWMEDVGQQVVEALRKLAR